jgi:hypothetical protein
MARTEIMKKWVAMDRAMTRECPHPDFRKVRARWQKKMFGPKAHLLSYEERATIHAEYQKAYFQMVPYWRKRRQAWKHILIDAGRL